MGQFALLGEDCIAGWTHDRQLTCDGDKRIYKDMLVGSSFSPEFHLEFTIPARNALGI